MAREALVDVLLAIVLAIIAILLIAVGSYGASTTDGLVARWEFEETDGDVAHDSSGNGHHGNLSSCSWDAGGQYGGAVRLAGAGSSIDCGAVLEDVFDGRHHFTVALWVNLDDTGDAADHALFSKFVYTGKLKESVGFALTTATARATLCPGDGNNTHWDQGELATSLAGQGWRHVAVTYDGSAVTIHLDGSPAATFDQAWGVGDTSGAALRLGHNPFDTTRNLSGALDDIRVYDRVLSASELLDVRDNVPPPVVSVTVTDGSASEDGPDDAAVTVGRTGDLAGDLVVPLEFAGTATMGADYCDVASPITIPAGSASASILLIPKDDAEQEFTETIVVSVVDGPDYDVGTPASVTVTLADNDSQSYRLLSPADGALGASLEPTLTWEASFGAAHYLVYVATDASFASPVVDAAVAFAATYQVSPGVLLEGTTYWWRVETDSGGAYDAARSFTTEATPGPFLQTTPADAAADTALRPALTWEPSVHAVTYDVTVAEDASFTTVAYTATGLTDTTHALTSALDPGHAWHWRVTARCGTRSTLATNAPATFTTTLEPAATISHPAPATAVIATVEIVVDADDDVAVDDVALFANGDELDAAIAHDATTWMFRWDTSATTDGTYVLTAVACDNTGTRGTSSPVALVVSNGGDWDGDGYANLLEHNAGADPYDPASTLDGSVLGAGCAPGRRHAQGGDVAWSLLRAAALAAVAWCVARLQATNREL